MRSYTDACRKVMNCIRKVTVQNPHVTACALTIAARKPSFSHNASKTSNFFFFSFQHHLSVIFSLPFSHLKAGHMNTGYTTLKNPLSNIKYHGKKKINLWRHLVPHVADMAQFQAAELSRTPGSWAKKTTCMFASCAWEQSWTTRYQWHQ